MTFTVLDKDEGTPISGATITVTTALGVLIGTASTLDDGQASLSLIDGEYTYTVSAPDYVTSGANVFTVSGADVSNEAVQLVAKVNFSATPLVQIGINPNHGNSAGIFVGLKDIRDDLGATVSNAMLASYEIEIVYDHNLAKILDVVDEAHLGEFAYDNTTPDKMSVTAAAIEGTSNFEELFFIPLALTGTSIDSANVIIKFVSLSDSNLNQIDIPDITLPLQRGKIVNEVNNGTVGLVDAVAGLQYLAKMVDSGTDTGKVNVINMASIVPPEAGANVIKPSVKDVIALIQYLVGLRDESFQLVPEES